MNGIAIERTTADAGTWSAPWMAGRTHGTWEHRHGKWALCEGLPEIYADMVLAALTTFAKTGK